MTIFSMFIELILKCQIIKPLLKCLSSVFLLKFQIIIIIEIPQLLLKCQILLLLLLKWPNTCKNWPYFSKT